MRANAFLSRAENASRSSKRVALTEALEYVELIRDIAALANSGGGVIVLAGVAAIDEELIHEQLAHFTEPEFEAFAVEPISRNGRPATAIVIDASATPLMFTRQGRHRAADGSERAAFARGGLYFRHGGKSEPATGADVRDFISRQLDATRTRWLANIRQVMHAPDAAEIAVVETAERDEEGRPTLIRLTTDPHAPLYGQVDPDQSHPYRQKEVIREVNARLGEGAVNAFDVLSVRRMHEITEETRPEFIHVPKFGSPQYSDAFVDWLVTEQERDPSFFARAKARYLATRPRRRTASTP